jgi:hypothetical protein
MSSVRDVKTRLRRKRVRVCYDVFKLTREKIIEVLGAAGFRAVEVQDLVVLRAIGCGPKVRFPRYLSLPQTQSS